MLLASNSGSGFARRVDLDRGGDLLTIAILILGLDRGADLQVRLLRHALGDEEDPRPLASGSSCFRVLDGPCSSPPL
jgi:hypothetical protein